MSATLALRWLKRAPRCTRSMGGLRVAGPLDFVCPWACRSLSTDVDHTTRLESSDDWSNFQQKHGFQKDLISFFSNFGSRQTRENSYQPHHNLHRPHDANSITLSSLVAAGAHMGHAKALLNGNFLPYSYGVRAGITIINLDYTITLLRRAANLVRSVAKNGGSVVFVGTRPDLKPAVERAARRMPQQGYHVGERWLPGTLTNSLSMFGAEEVQTTRIIPDVIIFLNPLANLPAIRECAVNHVPTIGIIDSNADPRLVMYPIPANDESVKTAEIISGVLSIAGREGILLRGVDDEMDAEQKEQRTQAIGRRTERIDLESYDP